MYCKNCGRELKDGMRFCDRCGQSVRQGNKSERTAKREEIEALKQERLNRKKKMAELEAKKAAEKKNRRKQRKAFRKNPKFIYITAIILIIIVSAAVSYMITVSDSKDANWKTTDNSVELNSTSAPTIRPDDPSITPAPTSTALPTVASEPENTDPVNADGYRVFTTPNNIEFPYPTAFTKKNAGDSSLLNLMDSVGGGSISLKEDKPNGMKSAEMMKEYAQSLGGTISYSRAGDNWYSITLEKNNFIYHRKCLIQGSKVLYYDFQYDKSSVSAAQYLVYIDYMDAALTDGQ